MSRRVREGRRSGRTLAAAGLCLAALTGAPPPPLAEERPPARVVSMNLCTDQLALLLAAPGQLVSVSWLAQDPHASAMAEQARAHHANTGNAEEVFLLKPDLVIAGSFTTQTTVDLLRRLGLRVAVFEPAYGLGDVGARIRQMGAALGRQAEAARLAERFEADLAAARDLPSRRLRAATYHSGSYTSGDATLAGDVIAAAGLANIAGELGLTGGGRLALEHLVMAHPDLIVTGRTFETPALAQEVFRHPALAALRSEAGAAPVADRDWICGTPHVMSAIRRLKEARDAVLTGN